MPKNKSPLRLLIFIFLIFLGQSTFAQENSTLSGTITDARSGETIIGAKVFFPEIRQGVTSNSYGFYSITIPADSHTVEIRVTGMETRTFLLDLSKNLELNVDMGGDIQEFEEIVVNAKADENTKSAQLGQIDFCLLYTSPSPRDQRGSRMPSSA